MAGFAFPSLWRREWVVQPLTAADGPAIAGLHQDGFDRPWSHWEFSSLLAEERVFGFAARREGGGGRAPDGFVLAREAAGEAEILAIAVAKSARRQGLARRMLDAVLFKLRADRAEALFLEVDAANDAALALYRRLGFAKVGERPGYYRGADGARGDALVMRLDLR